MPANLTPQYLSAEKEFRQATTTEEKIRCLEKMIALLPKHKGTDHLYGDLKRRLSKLKSRSTKKGGQRAPLYCIPKEGVAQVVLLGVPNVGKSRLVAALTSARVEVADYPFTTRHPVPGMMAFEDVKIQLIDMPPVTETYMEPWVPDMVRRADASLLVVDLGNDTVLEEAQAVLNRLERVKVALRAEVPTETAPDDPFTYRPAMLVCNKLDLPDAVERLEIVREEFAGRLPVLALSAATGTGLDDFRRELFLFLRLTRIYTKVPGKDPDLDEPFVLPAGSTVRAVAAAVHKELAEKINGARVWGKGVYPGQYVKLDHVLSDRDIVELHE